MPEDYVELLSNVFIDAANRTSAKRAIASFRASGAFPDFSFESTDIERIAGLDDASLFYYITYQAGDTLPNLKAGCISTIKGPVVDICILTQSLFTADSGIVFLQLQINRQPVNPDPTKASIALVVQSTDAVSPDVRHAEFTYFIDTKEKKLSVSRQRDGKPVYPPIELHTTHPNRFPDEEALPHWCMDVHALYTLDMPKTVALFADWRTTLHSNMTDHTLPEALDDIASLIINTNDYPVIDSAPQ